MDFNRRWTLVSLESEYEFFGVARIVKAHNDMVDTLNLKIEYLDRQLKDQQEALDREKNKAAMGDCWDGW